MCAIKKPNLKTKGNKIIKPRPFKSEEKKATKIQSEQTAQPEIQDEAVAQEEQSESLEQQQEQQSEPVEQQNEAVVSQQRSETPDGKVETFREIVEKHKNWLKKLKTIVPKQNNSFSEKDGAVTVVNDRNSKRVKLKGVVTEGLGYPDYIKFYVTDEEFVIQASTAEEEGSYKLRLEGKRKCLIYNSEVIELLTGMFDLDFTKGTSQTFGEVKFESIEGVVYAVIFKEA